MRSCVLLGTDVLLSTALRRKQRWKLTVITPISVRYTKISLSMVILCRYVARSKLKWMIHVHAYIVVRTLIVWARRAKELSLMELHGPMNRRPRYELYLIIRESPFLISTRVRTERAQTCNRCMTLPLSWLIMEKDRTFESLNVQNSSGRPTPLHRYAYYTSSLN